MKRQEVLTKLAEAWDGLVKTASKVPFDAMEEPGAAGTWSAKDVLGHVATWDRELQTIVTALHKGTKPPDYGEGGQWNERAAAGKRPLSPTEVLVDMGASHQRLVSFLEALPESAFDHPKIAENLGWESWGHYASHAQDIARWLASRSA